MLCDLVFLEAFVRRNSISGRVVGKCYTPSGEVPSGDKLCMIIYVTQSL